MSRAAWVAMGIAAALLCVGVALPQSGDGVPVKQCENALNRMLREYQDKSVEFLKAKFAAEDIAEQLKAVTSERDTARKELDELKKGKASN